MPEVELIGGNAALGVQFRVSGESVSEAIDALVATRNALEAIASPPPPPENDIPTEEPVNP